MGENRPANLKVKINIKFVIIKINRNINKNACIYDSRWFSMEGRQT